ncbi:hypothetical protein [Burkholderia sp. MSMB1826]|uniref:hypothetical protein n=1 Tax=Burkholderia sp. MSMB1826 TaxID=1637875 RepID=UPI000B2D56BB|nr:hypothetical protein [Burkholderia sp. MSMB1826]
MRKPDLIKSVDRWTWLLQNDKLLEGPVVINWRSLDIHCDASAYQRQTIRTNAKEYLEAVIGWREERLGGISGRSIRNRFSKLRGLVKWMSKRRLWRFSDLTPDLVNEFMRSTVGRQVGIPTKKTVQSWCALFTDMWLVRDRCRTGLRFDPMMHDSFGKWRNVGAPLSKWAPLREQFSVPLIKDAIEWTDHIGPTLVPILEKIWDMHHKTEFKSKADLKKISDRYLASIAETADFHELANATRMRDRPTFEVVRETLRLTLGAIVVQVLFLCGLRVSELVTLKCGCLTEHTHSDGYRYMYIEGTVAKSNGRRHKWIAPAPVCKSLQLAEKIFSFLGEQRNALLLSPGGNGSLPRRAQSFRRMSEAHAGILLRNFARSSWREYPFPAGARLHPHQGRKTFARFAVTRDKRALEALAQHYGHIHSGITDKSYVGVDIELDELLDRANQEDLASQLMDLISAAVVGGKAGASLMSLKTTYYKNKSFRGKRSLNSLIERMIADGIKLAPCHWGYCVYVEQLSACHGNELGPNEIERSPDVCARCSNFAVTEVHRPWWEARFRADEAFLQKQSLPEQTRSFVEQRLARSATLLRQINTSVLDVGNDGGKHE